ncbi:MAG: glycoside hydrolase, partial [Verrucomicrobia bacterium]|nr:glycoside hydrolase [Verrucomicrobiota bacterium]
ITLFDPAAQTRGTAQTRRANGQTEFHLQLAPGQSLFVFCGTDSETDYPVYQTANGSAVALDGDWKLSWKSGVPKIEEERLFQTSKSWTELGEPYDIFSGKLIYSRTFLLTPEQLREHWRLDLGDVRETARVTLNGTTLPLLWHIPFAVTLPDGLLRAENTLEIEVTNLSYNRIIDMDRRKVPWKNFHEINFVNIQYKNFDASEDKPLDSGLLSVPKLIPVRLESSRQK